MDLRSLKKWKQFLSTCDNAAEMQEMIRNDITSFTDDLTFTIPASEREVIKKFMKEQDEKVKLMVLNKIGKTTGCEVQNGLVKYGCSGEGYTYTFTPSTLCMNFTKIRNDITGEELDLTDYENEEDEDVFDEANTSQESKDIDNLLRNLHADTKRTGCPCENTSIFSSMASVSQSIQPVSDSPPAIPLPPFSKGTLTSTMYGDPVQCDAYCTRVTNDSAKLLLIYTGSYRNGQKLSLIINKIQNNRWQGVTGVQQIDVRPKKLENDVITGTYSSKSPADNGTFTLSSVNSDEDFPEFETTVTPQCVIM